MANCRYEMLPEDVEALLSAADETYYPLRNRAIVLLTVDAGLTITEIANLRRGHVFTDGLLGHDIRVPGRYARIVPMSPRLWTVLNTMLRKIKEKTKEDIHIDDMPVILPQRDQDGTRPMWPSSVGYVIYKLNVIGHVGAISSFSGRRTFVKALLDRVPLVGGATEVDVRTVTGLEGERSLARYIEPRHGRQRPRKPSAAIGGEPKRSLVESAARRGAPVVDAA